MYAEAGKENPDRKADRRISISDIRKKKKEIPVVMATAYDAWMAGIVDDAVDMILVGDSLGNVVQGHETTLPVTLEQIIYHTRMVMRGSSKAFVISDLPFLSYQSSVRDAVISAGRCLKEGLSQAVKLEGGKIVVPQIEAIVGSGVPVVGHVGLTPQSINLFGGHGKRAKTESAAETLMEDAKAIEEAGVSIIVLENIPHDLAGQVTETVGVPTVGIGAGPSCDGQVQVFHDLFGLFPDFSPRHAVKYLDCGLDMKAAIVKYAEDVRSGKLISK
ncbi:MAG: 3-methyl-2-oxobutanoate hydroxymethyltransferase [Proteobacteria bacterium]|nr:3-methyl-2-oxobutanoate hydroxymethyltransferase [Pseudomonadota bacterium]